MLKRINWWIVAAFGLLIILIVAGVLVGMNQPVDSSQLKTQINNLDAAAQEGVMIASEKEHQNGTYFQAQLQDLENNVDQSRYQIEKERYDPSITAARQKYLDIANEVSDQLHQLSMSWSDPNNASAIHDQLIQLKESLKELMKTL